MCALMGVFTVMLPLKIITAPVLEMPVLPAAQCARNASATAHACCTCDCGKHKVEKEGKEAEADLGTDTEMK